jgi:hypothetical protein
MVVVQETLGVRERDVADRGDGAGEDDEGPPALPAVPLPVSIVTPTMISCCRDRSMPMTWARKREALVR